MSGRAVALSVDGARLYGEWCAEPAPGRPTLVFLHDGLGSVEAWRGLPARLGTRLGAGAFAYDRRGYGRSDGCTPFPADFIQREAARLTEILRLAGIGDHATVGHSDGGTIALLHAARNPAGLRATVSLASHVHRDALAEAQLRRFRDDAARGTLPAWMARFHGAKAVDVASSWSAAWLELFAAGWDITPEIAAIAGPLLALHGEDDSYGIAGQLDSIARAAPHADARLLPGIGHFPHLDDPAGTEAAVAAFLAETLGLREAATGEAVSRFPRPRAGQPPSPLS